MESSKVTAKHIRQVAGHLPAAQIQLMHHQHMELPTKNYIKWKKMTKQKLQNLRPMESTHPGNPLIPKSWKHSVIDASDVGTQYTQKDFNALQENFSAKCVTNLGTSLQSAIRRTNRHQTHVNLENPRHTNFAQGPYTPIKMVTVMSPISQILMNHSVYR